MVPELSAKYVNKKQKNLQVELVRKGAVQKLALLWLLFLAIHALIVFVGSSHASGYNFLVRDWGFNNISYYSLPCILSFYAIGVVLCIPVVHERIIEILERVMGMKLFQVIGSRKFLKCFVFLLIGFVSVGVFRLYQIKYNFLGDMDIRVHQTVNQEFVETEIGTMYVMYHIYTILNSLLGLTGMQTFQWVSYFSGGAFIVLLLFIADELAQGPTQKVLFFLFSICFGTMQMFFGYVEIYCLPALSVLLYLYTGVLFIKGRVPGTVPMIALLVSIGMHVLSVALIPSMLVLLLYRRFEKWFIHRKITILYFVGLLLVGIPIIYFLAPMIGVKYFLVPLTEPKDVAQLMTLFSFEHLWEFLNSQLLASGMGFFLFLLMLLKTLWKKKKYDITMWFISTGGLGMLYLAFLTNAVRGSGDWDILAFPSIFYNIFGIYVVLATPWPKLDAYRFQYLFVIFLVFNGMSTAAWIGINASDRSILKIEDMIIGDPGYCYQLEVPHELSLASNYEGSGLDYKALEFCKRAYEHHYKDVRTHYSYAKKLMELNQTDLSVKILENLITKAPEYPKSYEVLLSFYVKQESAFDVHRIASKLFNVYLKRPDKFKSTFGADYLIHYFTFLREVEVFNKNEKEIQRIDQVLSQLK